MSEAEKRQHRCCFTGHRPEKLNLNEDEVKALLNTTISDAIERGFTTFISGMARGLDIWAAEVVLQYRKTNSNIKLICASPYEGFEQKWSCEWQMKYSHIMEEADLVRFICDGFKMSSFQIRNEWMVNHSALVIAAYNGESGGTRNTINYANKNGVPVINILS